MTPMPRKPCNYPGCPALIEGRQNRYCEKHQHAPRKQRKEYDTQRRAKTEELAIAARIRNSSQWKRIRKRKLAMNPLCEDPDGRHTGRTVTATQVHHVNPLSTHRHQAFDMENLQSLCYACHAAIEAKVRRGQ